MLFRSKAGAIDQYHEILRIAPDSIEALNNLAWILATCPDTSLRDGQQAVQLAERACNATGFKETVPIGTLAAAYAEAGQFDSAVATAQRACDHARLWHESELAQKNKELLELYRAGKPYRTR